jgi:hypothetical protein
MIANIYNQNFGWSVACDGYWAAVGNPSLFRYDPMTSSLTRTGSVEVYKYNINSDIHDYKTTLFRPLTPSELILLTTEYNNPFPTGPTDYIQTEYTGSIPYTADLDLSVDTGLYYTASEDGYGLSLDLRNTLLAIGNPYFTSTFTFITESFVFTGSGYVDLFDVSVLDIDPYAKRIPPTITSYFSSSLNGPVTVQANVPSVQNYSFVLLQSLDLLTPGANWINVSIASTSNSGGNVNIQTFYTNTDLVNLSLRTVGIVGTNPYLTTIYNPNPVITSSFGYSVSLNDEWLAVGSPLESGSMGAVFMFRKLDENNLSWSFFQTLPLPSDIDVDDDFGASIGMNKASSSFSWSMVVGSLKSSESRAYIYEFDGTEWNNTFTLYPDSGSIYPLPFYPTFPIVLNYPNVNDSFGHSVSMYGNTVMVGAPTDRTIQEYENDSLSYTQGSVYFFERCANANYGYYLARKSYGNEKIINNNMLGWSVSVYDQYAVAGVPKINALSSSICYLRGSLFQKWFCGDSPDALLNGQFILYNKNTGSIPDTTNIDWDISNIYQVKKQFLSPYRVYGWDANISNQFIIIGSPMLISGSNTIMDLSPFTGSFTGSVDVIGDLSGKSYIYNLKNLRPNFYVGNVFYRNGKMVIMTSGSNFEGLQLSNTVNEYDYDIEFTSSQTIFEKQVVCPVDIGEFNVSTNPTAIIFPNAEFDINQNGKFDFQDADVLLRYMAYKNTEVTGQPNTDWSSSIVDTTTNEEPAVFKMYSSFWVGTDNLFASSYSTINNTMYGDLDFNNDNKIDNNDMYILWKYFIYRLTQKNYNLYITPNSQNKFLANILDYMNSKTLRGQPPMINPTFLEYESLVKQDPTGSYLAPTVTSIGLYDGCDLVAIAKLGSPIKITPDFPINFVVKIDF